MQIRKRISHRIVNASNELVDFDIKSKLNLNMIVNSNFEIKFIIIKFIISIARLKRRIITKSICNSCIDKFSTLSKKTSLTKCTFQLIFNWFMFIEFRIRCVKISRIVFFFLDIVDQKLLVIWSSSLFALLN
jgi:hypothetical protein